MRRPPSATPPYTLFPYTTLFRSSVLRAYGKYLQQVGVPFSQSYVEETFNRYPLLARLVVALFEARFDPAVGSGDKAATKRAKTELQQDLHALAPDDATRSVLQPLLDACGGKRERQVDATRAALKGLLDRVASLEQDRIPRSRSAGRRVGTECVRTCRPRGA